MPVVHSIYNQGNVVSVTKNRIWIRFPDNSLKSFLFPQAFTEGFLSVKDDPDLLSKVERAQRRIKIATCFHNWIEKRKEQRLIAAITPLEEGTTVINSFHGEYAFLNPLSRSKFFVDNIEYANVLDAIKKLRENDPLIPLDNLLRKVLLDKYSNPKQRRKLLETAPCFFVFENKKHENVMGACLCNKCRKTEKQNRYGQILMEVRDT